MGREPHCLVCLSACSINTSDIGINLNIPGAGKSKLLNAELEQMFIAHRLLDMPKRWCERVLKDKQLTFEIKMEPVEVEIEDVNESVELLELPLENENDPAVCAPPPPPHPPPLPKQNSWFYICEECTNERIKPAWKVYQDLVAMETKLKMLKGAIKETLKETILERKKKKEWAGLTGSGLDVEIRRHMFPDLIVDGGRKRSFYSKPAPRCKKFPCVPPGLPKVDLNSDLEEANDKKIVMEWELEPDLMSGNEDDLRDEDFDIGLEALNDEDFEPRRRPKPKKKKKTKRKGEGTSSSVVKKLVKRIRKRKPRARETLKKFKCFECGSYFNSEGELGSHTVAHENRKSNGDGPFDCDQCSYPALSEEELVRHKKNRHERIRSRRCSKCNFRAKSWRALKEHVNKEHPETAGDELDKVSLTCNVCSRIFLRLENLSIHKRKMHPELYGAAVDEPVECTQCGQKFVSKITLGYHMENEHTERSSKYVCDICGKGFQYKCRLEHHKVVHYNKVKRDYVCHLCGIDYAHKGLLEKHYRQVHSGEIDGSADTASKTEDGNSKEEFKCRHCDLTSPYKVVILRHMQTHKMEAGHKCDKCGNYYMSEQGLRRHLKINHPAVKELVPCPWCMKTFPSREYMRTHQKHFCKLKNVEQTTVMVPESVAQPSVVGPFENPPRQEIQQQAVIYEPEGVDIKMFTTMNFQGTI